MTISGQITLDAYDDRDAAHDAATAISKRIQCNCERNEIIMKYGQTFREAYRQVRLKKEDNEVSMAVGQLKTMQDNLNQLMSILQSKGSDYELEAWVQSKITSANDKMTSATDYMKNSPSVSEDFDDINRERGSEKVGAKGEVERLKDQVQRLKLELENEKR